MAGTEIRPGEFVNPLGPLEGKRILVTGGTGSLGQVLVRRILTGEFGKPAFVRIMSRDEGKQHRMRAMFSKAACENEAGLIYRSISGTDGPLRFMVGDVRSKDSLRRALVGVDVVFNAAALKQVPSCEYYPTEAVETNVMGPYNLVQAILETPRNDRPEAVVGISTDKACKPVNVMGMTKAVQERVFQKANLDVDRTIFTCVRYGNVLASRGSVIPLFLHQIAKGGPVTVTDRDMTRFFLTLDQAVDTVMHAVSYALPGETVIPRVPSARIMDLAEVMTFELDKSVEVKVTEIRPGEKLHEELISSEEAGRSYDHAGDAGKYFRIRSVLPEVRSMRCEPEGKPVDFVYSSRSDVMGRAELRELLKKNRLFEQTELGEEVLR